jgi:hypothetical protein
VRSLDKPLRAGYGPTMNDRSLLEEARVGAKRDALGARLPLKEAKLRAAKANK